ncbi:MAG TPA: hypothetical protein VEX36_06990 [Thermoleophilaceae bacterium]|nr:hypothetical protein [Thermoleophilaceae bacterium]
MGANRDHGGAAGIDRRRFIRDAGAIAAVAASGKLLTGLDDAASGQRPLAALNPRGLVERGQQGAPKDSVLIGQVVSGGDRSLVIKPLSARRVTVDLAPNAHVSKEGSSSLTSFRPGDEAVLLGKRTGDHFTAVGVAPLYRERTGTVYSRNGERLKTGGGEIILTPNTVPRAGFCNIGTLDRLEERPLGEIAKGDAIVARGPVNQITDVMTAATVGVRAFPLAGDPLALR